MASLKSISEHLKNATESLDQAVNEISELPLEPKKELISFIGRSIGNIIRIQQRIYQQCPELEPEYLKLENQKPDPDLTEEELKLVQKLSHEEVEEIDNLLVSYAGSQYRKVAKLVGSAMMDLEDRKRGIPDIYYALRVRSLVEEGRLESQGNLQYMRYSEVRLPKNTNKET